MNIIRFFTRGRGLQTSPLLLTVLLFLLPFVQVSCEGYVKRSFTAVELATGTTIREPGGSAELAKVPAQPAVVIALILIALGVVVVFADFNSHRVICAAFAFAAFISVLIAKQQISARVEVETGGHGQVEALVGFYLICAGLWSGILLALEPVHQLVIRMGSGLGALTMSPNERGVSRIDPGRK